MFGSGKVNQLEAQLRNANDRLDQVTKEKNDLQQKLDSATAKISNLEAQLSDFDLEQLKEEAKTAQAEYEALKSLYAQKNREFDDSREDKEIEFTKKAAVDKHNLENEIRENRQANMDFVSSTIKNFTDSYNYYFDQIRLLMNALGDVAKRTGETLFTEAHEDMKVHMGIEMAEMMKADTDSLRSEEDGLVLITSSEEAIKQVEPEEAVEEAAEAAEEVAEAAEEAVEEAVEAVTEAAEGAPEEAEEAAEKAEETIEEAAAEAEAAVSAAEGEVSEEAAPEAAEEIAEAAEDAKEAVEAAEEYVAPEPVNVD